MHLARAQKILKNQHFLPLDTPFRTHQRVRNILLNFIKKRLQHGCFPVNIAKILKIAYFIEHLRWLLYFHERLLYRFWTEH